MPYTKNKNNPGSHHYCVTKITPRSTSLSPSSTTQVHKSTLRMPGVHSSQFSVGISPLPLQQVVPAHFQIFHGVLSNGVSFYGIVLGPAGKE